MILIFGLHGQLAKALQEHLTKENKKFIALSKTQCDVGNYDQLKNAFNTYNPQIVINASAYNFVDDCEENIFDGFKTNAYALAHMAELSKQYGCFLVHFSTDYVFDGTKCGLYEENDIPKPLNEYGKSKLLGEYFVIESGCKYLIFRTSWVYGRGQNNFVSKLIGWCKTNEYLQIAFNEFSVPTSAYELAQLSLLAVDKDLTGLYHLVNSGYCSRFEWAKFILKQLKIDKFIYPTDRAVFKLKANRPFFSAMSNELISHSLNIEIKDWQSAMLEFFQNHYEK